MLLLTQPVHPVQFERQFGAHVRMISDTVSNRFAEKQQAATAAAAVFVYPPGGQRFWAEFEVRKEARAYLLFFATADALVKIRLASNQLCQHRSLTRPRLQAFSVSVLPISSTRDLGLSPIITPQTRQVRDHPLHSLACAAHQTHVLTAISSAPQAFEEYVRLNHSKTADPATYARLPEYARHAVNVRRRLRSFPCLTANIIPLPSANGSLVIAVAAQGAQPTCDSRCPAPQGRTRWLGLH